MLISILFFLSLANGLSLKPKLVNQQVESDGTGRCMALLNVRFIGYNASNYFVRTTVGNRAIEKLLHPTDFPVLKTSITLDLPRDQRSTDLTLTFWKQGDDAGWGKEPCWRASNTTTCEDRTVRVTCSEPSETGLIVWGDFKQELKHTRLPVIQAPEYPVNDHPIFPHDEVTTISFEMVADSFQRLRKFCNYKNYWPATNFKFRSSKHSFDGDEFQLRAAGNLGLMFHKKSFVLKFKDNVGGLRKFKLKANAYSASGAEERIASESMRAFGAFTYRTSFTRLFINKQYQGIYTLVEVIETKEFWQERTGCFKGCIETVSKCYGDILSMVPVCKNKEGEILQLIQSIESLELTLRTLKNETSLIPAVTKPVNFGSMFRHSAVNLVLENWDDYLHNWNNWYMAETKDHFLQLSHDLEMSLNHMTIRNPDDNDNVPVFFQRDLFQPVTRRSDLKAEFREQLQLAFDMICKEKWEYRKFVEDIRQLIYPAVIADPAGYTMDKFNLRFNGRECQCYDDPAPADPNDCVRYVCSEGIQNSLNIQCARMGKYFEYVDSN